MSCSPFDLRDYFLQELTDPQRRQVEVHVQSCANCRQEMEQLRVTEAALFSLREEEIPQRIAFVSDPVFEPSPARRWFNVFWNSPARLGFAGAAILSIAILFSSLTRVASGPLTSADVEQRIQAAVAASEARQTQNTNKLVHDVVMTEHNQRLIAENQAEYLQKLSYTLQRSKNEYVQAADQRGYK